MSSPALICLDGSELALQAAVAGLEVLRPDAALKLVAVIAEPDPTLVTGGGFTGSTMSAEAFDAQNAAAKADAEEMLATAQQALGLESVEHQVLIGSPGPTVCAYAEEIGATVIVIGSRGHGGLRRAFLGSVSDHIIRHAHCPVLVSGHDAVEEDD
ncbi:MAG: universal stress protein [Candidatus Microthrix sp.]|nr:universal stress protein [Candidatus Microthrix sp.]